jgi:hypothetical protein
MPILNVLIMKFHDVEMEYLIQIMMKRVIQQIQIKHDGEMDDVMQNVNQLQLLIEHQR